MFGFNGEVKKISPAYDVKFSEKYNALFLSNNKIEVYSLSSGEKVTQHKVNRDILLFDIDELQGRLVMKNTSGSIFIYDLETMQLISTLKSNRKYKFLETQFTLLPETNTILDIVKDKYGEQIAEINIETSEIKLLTQFTDTQLKYNQSIEKNVHLFTCEKSISDDEPLKFELLKVEQIQSELKIERININNSELSWRYILFNQKMNVWYIFESDTIYVYNEDFSLKLHQISLNDLTSEIWSGVYGHYLTSTMDYLYIIYGNIVVCMNCLTHEIIAYHKVEYGSCIGGSANGNLLFIGTWKKSYLIKTK